MSIDGTLPYEGRDEPFDEHIHVQRTLDQARQSLINVKQEIRQNTIQFITKVAACWTDDILVSNVLDSLIWEFNNDNEEKETL